MSALWRADPAYYRGSAQFAISVEVMDAASARDLLMSHPPEYLLFGTDSPWGEQSRALSLLRHLQLGDEREALILSGNASRLLNACKAGLDLV